MSETLLAASTRDPRIGQIVQDRYRIVRKIGEGGMGAVYEGEHTVIRRKVAIKCLHAQYATNQEMVNRFQREAMAANTVRHPNIVEVTDMGRFDDGAVFMVLEYLEGSELSGLLTKEGALPLSRVVHIIGQACDALAAAHEHDIVHRDLKPDNIFIVPRGEEQSDFVKILDFGIAKFRESGGAGMTRTGMTMGTPHYMAPEQAQASKDLDHRADIYSLGVILFHCITGQLPYDDESFPMLMVKVVSHPAPRLRSLVPDIPEAIDELVDRMLAKNPALRPSSCKEVKAALMPFRDVHVRYAAGRPPEVTAPPSYAPQVASSPGNQMTRPLSGAELAAATSSPSQPGYDNTPGYGSVPSHPSYGAEIGSSPSMATYQPPSSKLPLILAVLAVLLLGIVGAGVFAFVYFGMDESPIARTEPATDTPPRDPPASPTQPTAQNDPSEPAAASDDKPGQADAPSAPPSDDAPTKAPEVAAPQTVRVQISVSPEGAELFLDGHPIANPFDADLPQQSEPRRLEARRAGYRTFVQDLVLMHPQRINITLRRGSGVDDQRRSSGTSKQGSSASSTGTSASSTGSGTSETRQPSKQTADSPRQDPPRPAPSESVRPPEPTVQPPPSSGRRDDGFETITL